MKLPRLLSLVWLIGWGIAPEQFTHGATITVFAAASLTESLQTLAATYRTLNGDEVIFNFAASGSLVRQIEAGAPADLFISADESHMDQLAAQDLIIPDSRRDLLGNTLILVAPADNYLVQTPSDLTNAAVHRIALGQLKSVPCGDYAQKYFVQTGRWTAIAPKVIPCASVRAVLATVESGEVDAGIVYKTDLAVAHHLRVVCEIPAHAGPRIAYPVALVRHSPASPAATRFLSFLESPTAATAFRSRGFIVLRP